MDRQGSILPVRPSSAPRNQNSSPRRRTSITTWLRWSYLISATLPLTIVGILLIGVLFNVERRHAYSSQQAVADQIASNVSTFLYDLEQLLLRASYDLHPEMPGPYLNATTHRLADSSPDLRALVIVDTSGTQVASAVSSIFAGRIEPAPGDTALFTQAYTLGQGGRTPIRLGADGNPYFQVVLPIRNQYSVLVGAMSAEVSAARISQILQLAVQGNTKVAFLIDPQHTLMLASRTQGWQPASDMSILFAEQDTVGEYAGANGEQMVGARALISPVTHASWSVVVEQPAAEFLTEVYRSAILLTSVVGVVGLLAIGWAFYQAGRIVRPLRTLAEGAHELGAGHLDHRMLVPTRDELGHLADTFNQMAERLQASLNEIADQNERLRHGLILARDIQMGLMPSSPPWKSELLTVYARSLPASEVGGDFYTYMALPGGRAAVAIGDISGKGVAAALLMALTSSTLESQAQVLDRPGEMLDAMQEALCIRLQANQMNAALLIAIYDPGEQQMVIANAGMISPLLIHTLPDGGSEYTFLDVCGLPIGTSLPSTYTNLQVDLVPGDTMIFMSDGIVEAHNRVGELYGFERLEAFVASLPRSLSVAEIVQQIIDAVLAFSDGAEPHDDSTILVTRCMIDPSTYDLHTQGLPVGTKHRAS
ncbi:SpoIIE family protein phosphatase [Candidatus Oscillochloris fontis]|uniref:SpoIIE family protein phosphatase n=1 Tax=Candidatus Oscillochloris fontis TaxID=2496868 RepID=UPI00101E1553|nr:SpoIIE family protein phosphatase [Candidatus Oscillochloris fontis]